MSASARISKFLSRLSEIRSTIADLAAARIKGEVGDYCQLMANDGERAVATDDMGLVGYFRLRGAERVMDAQAVDELTRVALESLGTAVKEPGLRVDIAFSRDPEGAEAAVEESLAPCRETARRIGLTAGPLLDDKRSVLGEWTCREECVVAVQLGSGVLSPWALRTERSEERKRVEEAGSVMLPGAKGQSPWGGLDAVRAQHEALMEQFRSALRGLSLVRLDVREAMRALKALVEPELAVNWQPRLLGDRFPLRAAREPALGDDLTHVLPLTLGRQLLFEDIERKGTLVRIGKRWYAPVSVTMPPMRISPFIEFFASVPSDLPWRLSVSFRSGHDKAMSVVGRKSSIAAVVAFSNAGNSTLIEACNELRALADGGEPLGFLSISLTTWATDLGLVLDRRERMAKALQGWGQMEVMPERGDPLAVVLEGLPGFVKRVASPALVAPVGDVMGLWPIGRPTSPWDSGPSLLRTIDRKLFPLHPGSAKQPSVVDLCFAPQGTGKSVKVAADNMGFLLSPGLQELPRVAILDIGPSSSYFVRLVRTLLPQNRRHEAQALALSTDGRIRINPFDTPLGCRRPFAYDRQAMVSLVELLLTPAGSGEGVMRLPELAGELVDAMYDLRSDADDRAYPNRYESGVEPEVDKAVADLGLRLDDETTWWTVVDGLFDGGRVDQARTAQLHAVPTLGDLTEGINASANIKDLYRNAKLGHGERLLDFVTQMIPAVLAEYPMLAGVSSYSLTGARVVSVDLMGVSGQASAQGEKRTAVMYMATRQMLCQDFYRDLSVLNEVPERYVEHHRSEVERGLRTPKRLCMDEYHRVKGCRQVMDQAVRDAREGRKFGVQVVLASQLLDDFGPEITGLASNVWIMGRGVDEADTQAICNRFALSREAGDALRTHVRGPTREGAPMIYVARVSDGAALEHCLRLTLGPLELWAYSTTPEDMELRRLLIREVGVVRALRLLAEAYPAGTVKSLVQEGEAGVGREAVYERLVRGLVERAA